LNMTDDPSRAVPPDFRGVPGPLMGTLLATYTVKTKGDPHLPWAMGFAPADKTPAEMTFADVLQKLRETGQLEVMTAVYNRCVTVGIWQYITHLRHAWGSVAGKGVSKGFQFTCAVPDRLVDALRASSGFCRDIWPMNADHQTQDGKPCPRDTYREIVQADTEGLHVCVVLPSHRTVDAWGGPHDIHIDLKQIGCSKRTGHEPNVLAGIGLQNAQFAGCCSYDHLIGHAKTVIPYYLGKLGVTAKVDNLVTGYIGLAQHYGDPQRIPPDMLARMVKSQLTVLPMIAVSQITDWLGTVVSEWARRFKSAM
jgi:hypothetical protein